MGWDKNQPVGTASLATSQGLISGNFIQVESVLGSSTLTNGITKAQGDIFFASTAETIQKLAAGSAGQALTTRGASANPSWDGMTTQGDIEYHNGTTRARLAAGTSGKFLITGGGAGDPSWTLNPNLSNIAFFWFGVDTGATNSFGRVTGTNLTPDMSTYTINYNILGVYGNTYRTILPIGKFIKTAGVSTLTIHARIWEASGSTSAILFADVGGVNHSIARNGNTPGWATGTDLATINVSGLTNGSIYDITIQLKNSGATTSAFCGAVMLIAS